jgi:hypothetical protein
MESELYLRNRDGMPDTVLCILLTYIIYFFYFFVFFPIRIHSTVGGLLQKYLTPKPTDITYAWTNNFSQGHNTFSTIPNTCSLLKLNALTLTVSPDLDVECAGAGTVAPSCGSCHVFIADPTVQHVT